MGIPHLTQLRLSRFKAFEEQVLPLASLTMLIGPNGSGKSNALDALTLLALLASDRTLTDLDRDDADVAGLRGGLRGCAPFGEGLIEVGATVDLGDGGEARLDVALDPARSEVVRETLELREEGSKKPKALVTAERTADSGLVTAHVYTSRRAKHITMPANRLVTFQATTRVPEDTRARRQVVETARQVVQVLAGILVLDPIPSAMRTYARIGAPPGRTGASLSAQLYAIRSDPAAWQQLLDLVRGLIGNPSAELTFAEGRLPDSPGPVDVMVALDEAGPHGAFPVPASTMSDGTLRYLAILAALLTAQQPGETGETPRTVVIEEIENGLFPDQASQVLALLRRQAATQRVTLVTTTHSPALLDAVTADDHDHVITVRKDDSARSLLVPLTEHEDYVGLVQAGRLGHEVARGRLRVSRPAAVRTSVRELFA